MGALTFGFQSFMKIHSLVLVVILIFFTYVYIDLFGIVGYKVVLI